MLQRRLTRRSALALGVASSITLLAACGGDDDSPESIETASETTAATEAEGDETQAGSASESTEPEETESEETSISTEAAQDDSTAESEDDVPRGGVLRFTWNSDARSLAPYQFTASIERCVGTHIFETLVVFEETSKDFLPALATSWEISSDGTEWTFHLLDDVVFHDGTPFDAEAVKFTFDWISNPDSKSSPFTTGFLEGYVESEVVSPTEVKVVFSEPNGRFFDGVSGYYLSMLSPTAVTELGDDFASQPVGTGPFRFKEWVSNERIELEQYADHTWGFEGYDHVGPSYLDGISVRIIEEDVTRTAALEQQEVDMINLSFTDTPRFTDNSSYQTVVSLRPGTVRALHFNVMNEPLNDLNVRKAIGHAVNPDNIVLAPFFGGAAAVARTPLSPSMIGFDESLEAAALEHDLDEAGRLLDEAGWSMGDDGTRQKDGAQLSLKMLAPSSVFMTQVAELVQGQLLEIGVATEIVSTDWGTVFGIIANGEYDLMIGGAFQSDLGVIDVVYDPQTAGSNGLLFTRTDDQELADQINSAAQTVEPSERLEAYRAIQEYVMENVLVVPLYIEPYVFVSRPEVQGLLWNRDAEPRFHNAYIG